MRRFLLVLALALVHLGCDGAADLAILRAAISNGTYASHAGLGTVVTDNQGEVSVCTGSLIGPRTVLTAAHCLTEGSAGSTANKTFYFWGRDGLPSSTAELNRATSVAVHPSYRDRDEPGAFQERVTIDGKTENVRVSDFDLAVVHLSQPEPIAKPFRVGTVAPTPGQTVSLYGMGKTEQDRDDGNLLRTGSNTIEGVGSSTFYLVGATGSEGNLCSGDSGGPTIVKISDEEVIIGVHSLGTCTFLRENKFLFLFTTSTTDISVGFDARTDVARSWIEAQLAKAAVAEPALEAAPEIKVTSPASATGPNYTLRFDVTGPHVITSVLVKENDVTLWSDMSLALPQSFTVELPDLQPGPHVLQILAIDAASKQAASDFALELLDAAGEPPTDPSDNWPTDGMSSAEEGGCQMGPRPIALPSSALVLLLLAGLLAARRFSR